MELSIIQTDLDSAKLYYLQNLTTTLTKLKAGCGSVKPLLPLKRLIRALQWQVDAEVNDSVTSALYGCMMRIIGSFNKPYVIDPSVVIPGDIFVIEAIDYAYDETYLVEDGEDSGNWYLPYLKPDDTAIPTGTVPIFVTIDNISNSMTFDDTFSPPRIYGFANNDPQSIVVTTLPSNLIPYP